MEWRSTKPGKRSSRVIVIEDDQDDLDLLLRELKRGGYGLKHAHVESRAGLEEALNNGPWDIIISDWSLPAFDGLAAYRLMRERGVDLPFIIVSGTIAEEYAVEALKAGVNDFITKGRFARLLPAIDRELREAEVRRQKKIAEADLERQRVETDRLELARSCSVLQSVPDGVIVIDANGAIREWSAGADAVLRMPRSDAPLSAWPLHTSASTCLTASLLRRRSRRSRSRATSIAKSFSFATPVYRRAPGFTSARAPSTTRTVRDVARRNDGRVRVFRDDESRRRAEEQLMISDRMASVGMLAAGVAHEINNPLGAVLLNLEISHDMISRPAEPAGRQGALDRDAGCASRAVGSRSRDRARS